MKHNVPVQSLIDHIKTAVDVDPWAKDMAEELLKEHETVVHCKDCKNWHTNCLPSCGRHGCDVFGDYTKPDDFCSFAERKGGR